MSHENSWNGCFHTMWVKATPSWTIPSVNLDELYEMGSTPLRHLPRHHGRAALERPRPGPEAPLWGERLTSVALRPLTRPHTQVWPQTAWTLPQVVGKATGCWRRDAGRVEAHPDTKGRHAASGPRGRPHTGCRAPPERRPGVATAAMGTRQRAQDGTGEPTEAAPPGGGGAAAGARWCGAPLTDGASGEPSWGCVLARLLVCRRPPPPHTWRRGRAPPRRPGCPRARPQCP